MQGKLEINALLLQIAAQFAIADADDAGFDTWELSFSLEKQAISLRLQDKSYFLKVENAKIWPEGHLVNTKDAMRDVCAEMSMICEMTIKAVSPAHDDYEYLRFHFVRFEEPEITYGFEITDVQIAEAPEHKESAS